MWAPQPEVPEMSDHAHRVWKRAIRKYRLERYKQAVHHATMSSHPARKRLAAPAFLVWSAPPSHAGISARPHARTYRLSLSLSSFVPA